MNPREETEYLHRRQTEWENGGRQAWIEAHDYPRCPHGVSTFAICEDCRGFEVPSSNVLEDGQVRERCPHCLGGVVDGNDACQRCWGSGLGEEN